MELVRGWVLDVYPSTVSGLIVWRLTDDDRWLRLRHEIEFEYLVFGEQEQLRAS